MTDRIQGARARLSSQLVMDIALHQLFSCPVHDETPGARLRQFGLMAIFIDLHNRKERVTVTRIAENTGMARGAVQEILDALEGKGIIASNWVKNTVGRGKAREYRLRDETTIRVK